MSKRALSQEWKYDLSFKIKVIHNVKRQEKKTHMISSIYSVKAFNKLRRSFLIETLNNLGLEGNFSNMIKCIYKTWLTPYLILKFEGSLPMLVSRARRLICNDGDD